MRNEQIAKRLEELLGPLVRSEGLILVELIYRSEGSGKVIRLFVDRPEGGVTLDECSLISRQASDLLDVEDPIAGRHRLEVSSPGLNRALKGLRDFEIFAGRRAKLVVRRPDGGSETLRGRLMGVKGGDVLIDGGEGPMAVPQDQVAKANLDMEI